MVCAPLSFSLFGHFRAPFSLLSGRPPESLFRCFFSGFRACHMGDLPTLYSPGKGETQTMVWVSVSQGVGVDPVLMTTLNWDAPHPLTREFKSAAEYIMRPGISELLSPTRNPELFQICENEIFGGKPTKKQNWRGIWPKFWSPERNLGKFLSGDLLFLANFIFPLVSKLSGFWVGFIKHTPSTAGAFRKKFRKNSGKTPETLSERFLEFLSRVRLGCPKPYNSRHLRLPERFQNSLPPSTAGDASFFRSGSGEGLSELVMEFPAVLGAFPSLILWTEASLSWDWLAVDRRLLGADFWEGDEDSFFIIFSSLLFSLS